MMQDNKKTGINIISGVVPVLALIGSDSEV